MSGEMVEIDITDDEPFTEEQMFLLVRRAISDPGSILPREAGESVSNWSARAVTAVIDVDARNRAAARIAEETNLQAMDFRNGVQMELRPAQTIAARTVAAARTLLGDAPNYSETLVEFETKLAGEAERYSFVVQRVAPGKLTPHEARQRAEAERDALKAVATDALVVLTGDATGNPVLPEVRKRVIDALDAALDEGSAW